MNDVNATIAYALAAQLREAQARVVALEAENEELRDTITHADLFWFDRLLVRRSTWARVAWQVLERIQDHGSSSLAELGEYATQAEAIAAARALAGKDGE